MKVPSPNDPDLKEKWEEAHRIVNQMTLEAVLRVCLSLLIVCPMVAFIIFVSELASR